ncbi:MAG: SRPBCC domain-containing protein [Propionicimonas sp.]|uniref:SRPBCC family protein n=1 Tax=Propionicimonas sp. TaxID=1955623 RepID=UPI002B1ECF4F|nr:SRPBCC domain-containing protein [Propionicimonas sp.]MEA4945930.1 SRPBCC domain-containing protein [Propionicimonas sp.]MEA5053140.1 SRPBCC domain-containing protein [Propionicimonas sp.]MEA5116419.1 SRPBCC domain-containing protein [Propionicimonas sp.]
MTEQVAGDTLANAMGTTVTVGRVVSLSPKEVWRFLVTRDGAEALLGDGAVLGDKGDSWRAANGTYGVVRSYHPLEQIRFSWHAADDTPKTLVDVHLIPEDGGTRIEIRHEQIPHYFDVVAITKRWEAALAKVDDASALAGATN